MIPSTALHILRTLVHEDLIVLEPNTKRYSLGTGILGIARDMLGGSNLVQAVQSHLENIAATFDIAAIAVELRSHEHIIGRRPGPPSRAVVAIGLAAQLDDGQRQVLARRLHAVADGLAD